MQFGTVTALSGSGTKAEMSLKAVIVVFVPVLAFATLNSRGSTTGSAQTASGQTREKQEKPGKESKGKTDSLTGCVDQQEGRYVLIDNRTMNAVAALEADGFPPESFAKHVGHRVTVHGTSSRDGAVPHFKVRNIETIKDICTPQPEQGKP